MTDCLIWNTLVPFNLATPTAPVSLVSSPTLATTIAGPAGYATGGSSFSSPNHGNMAAGDLTMRVRFIPVSISGLYTSFISKGSVVSGTRELVVFLNNSLQVQFVAIGGGGADGVALGSFTLGAVHELVITRLLSDGGTIKVYQNGAALTWPAGQNAGVSSSADTLVFGIDPDTGSNGDNKYLAFNFWNRVLSAGEVFQLYRDPYGFLSYPQDAVRVAVAGWPPAGPYGTPNLVQSTLRF